MKKWGKRTVSIAGWLSLLGGIIVGAAIASGRSDAGGRPIAWLAATFMLFAIALILWSVRVRGWTTEMRHQGQDQRARLRSFLLNASMALALWTCWLFLLLTHVLHVDLPAAERWFVSLGVAWMLTPFTSLAQSALGKKIASCLEAPPRAGK